jgi:hypothetical protein
VHDLLAWLQGSALGHFMRESGPWTYALVNLAHILGVGALFGSILVLDLRLMGVWRRVPLDLLSATSVPVAATGFLVAAATGVGLLATKATEYAGNPFFAVKLGAIAVGLANVLVLHLSPGWHARGARALTLAETRRLRALGAVSLVCWLTAVAAGRMVGYW